MKNYLCFTLLLICLPVFSFAQEINYGSTLYEFNAGKGLTMSNFGASSLTNSKSGFAKNGFWLDASYTTFVTPNVGFRLMLYLTSYAFDSEKFIAEMKAYFPTEKLTVSAKSWEMYGFMGGIKISIPFSESTTSLETNLLAGYLHIESPEIAVRTSRLLLFAPIEKTTGWAGNAGVTLRFNSYKRTNFTLGIDYFVSNPAFLKYKQSINVLTIKAGIALRK